MKVAFCASEAVPLAKTGGLADVIGALPLALRQGEIQADIFLPFYKIIDRKHLSIEKITSEIYKTTFNQTDIYLIANDFYFDRDGIYGDEHGPYEDNCERFQFFSLKVLEAFKVLNIHYDVVHCHDWHTALIPVYLKYRFQEDEFYASLKSVLTIHNLAYQGVFPLQSFEVLGLKHSVLKEAGFFFYDQINLLKAGIVNSDRVTTVSPQYAKEIQTKEFGCGLEDILSHLIPKVQGILNGLDYSIWNPENDAFLPSRYNAKDYEAAKLKNKLALQKRFGLKEDPQAALLGFVGRFAHQKGIDLLADVMPELKNFGCQIVIQGVGDKAYESMVKELCQEYKGFVGGLCHFDEACAHQIYGGSDFFLMPSLFEPCGLSQMISLAYGTIPIVSRIGGLADTVVAFDKDKKHGNGFNFENNNRKDFVKAIQSALKAFVHPHDLETLRKNAFNSCFSWEQSAKEYKKVYQC